MCLNLYVKSKEYADDNWHTDEKRIPHRTTVKGIWAQQRDNNDGEADRRRRNSPTTAKQIYCGSGDGEFLFGRRNKAAMEAVKWIGYSGDKEEWWTSGGGAHSRRHDGRWSVVLYDGGWDKGTLGLIYLF
ncbi:unnamed protein product [Cuscuta epithymum]|uniref:Uncharacterized protein n=1 Tax=Cuscuta epithymum TaxID=186058 RepID=A0AAV0CLF6_9ASTE|nr:unnamed protein product [Cuscuta epithymum]